MTLLLIFTSNISLTIIDVMLPTYKNLSYGLVRDYSVSNLESYCSRPLVVKDDLRITTSTNPSRLNQTITPFLPNIIEEQSFVIYPFAYNVDEICEIYTKFKALRNESVYSIQINSNSDNTISIRAFAIVSKIAGICYFIDEKQTVAYSLSNIVTSQKLSTKAMIKTLYNINTPAQITVTKIRSNKKKLIKELCTFDKKNTMNAQFVTVGILYVKTADTDFIMLALEAKYKLKDTSNGFRSLLTDMDINEDIDPDNKFDDTFNGMCIKWHIGPLMSKQSIRQYIGNANFIIICKDGRQPLQLNMLEALGKFVQYYLVVEPVCSIKSEALTLVDCEHMEASKMFTLIELITFERSRHFYRLCFIQKTRNVISPVIPIAHLFSNTAKNNIKDFILTKIHNSIVRTKTSSRMYTDPRSVGMKELWNTYGNK